MTSTVVTYVASTTMHSRDKWIQALFCGKLRDNMNAMFASTYAGAGARVKLQ